jgi:hypothetical protein
MYIPNNRYYTVILFSSRYLLPAKSICPTLKQTIYISVQMRAAPPPNGKAQHIYCLNLCCWAQR